jgi:hypothetical protein
MNKIVCSYQLGTINSTEVLAEFKQQMNIMEHELKEIMEHASTGQNFVNQL